MAQSLDQSYLKEYSQQFTERICSGFFATKEFIGGSEIVALTPCKQLNLMVIKSLFVAWQSELEKMKKNPFFDYGDEAVQEALESFMNTLSQAIRVSRSNFMPLLRQAVEDTIVLAVDPKAFLEIELAYSAGRKLQTYFKENKKYIKWHAVPWMELVEATERFSLPESLSMAFDEILANHTSDLADPVDLLKPLQEVLELDIDALLGLGELPAAEVTDTYKPLPALKVGSESQDSPEPSYEEELPAIGAAGSGQIDPALAWARFERESYGLIKGTVRSLAEDIGINQRFMFTRKLFLGNPETLNKALSDLDAADSFFEAIELLNSTYMPQLGWELQSEELTELLFLVFRKFAARN
ncbi:MAG: hypothetical protein JJU34_02030 [Lunatimonas sp.]|uniref:hypothetical protein n=1 Tax=Lunatimonas sp. TaxID=2060141 RepID=UPI00263B903B|nr:hypothetical protein [Lunatimonas sp.]MCC5936037.1 hypothetical protein [Lunatimonas sp.]